MINIHQTKKYNRLGGLDYPENQQENKSKLIRKEYPRIREYSREKDGEIYNFYRVDCRGRGWRGQQLPEFKKRSEAEEHARDVAKKVISGEGNVSADWALSGNLIDCYIDGQKAFTVKVRGDGKLLMGGNVWNKIR